MTSILIFFCFTTETVALRYCNDYSKTYTVTRISEASNEKFTNAEYGPAPIKLIKSETTSIQQNKELACNQKSNVTVVDSKQVKVKYDFWIVKFFKKLFGMN